MPSLDEVAPDNTQKYRKAETMPPLDIPPDLSTSRINDQIAGNQQSSATYSEYEEASTNPLAARYNITPESKPALSGEGDDRHLVVPGDRDETWQRIEAFWADINMNIHRKDQRIGLMDTQPDVDGYAYRVRMERGDVNRSARVYVNGVDDTNRNNQKDEAMLRQLAEYLGGLYQQDKARAEASLPSSAAQQTEARVILLDEAEGQQALLVEQEFTTVWVAVVLLLKIVTVHVVHITCATWIHLTKLREKNLASLVVWLSGKMTMRWRLKSTTTSNLFQMRQIPV